MLRSFALVIYRSISSFDESPVFANWA